jgi:trans-aconitate methyltransferase
MFMQTNWDIYHRNFRQLTAGRILRHFHWKAYLSLLEKIHYDRKVDILELGSGTGFNTLGLCKYFDVRKITVVDSNPVALKTSRRLFGSLDIEKEFIEADVTKYHTDGKYDLVHSHGLIEHFSVSEMNRLIERHVDFAAPEGYIIIFVPTPEGNYKRFRRVCEFFHLWPFPDERPVLRQELLGEIRKYNIVVIDTIIYTVFYPTLGILVKKGSNS